MIRIFRNMTTALAYLDISKFNLTTSSTSTLIEIIVAS